MSDCPLQTSEKEGTQDNFDQMGYTMGKTRLGVGHDALETLGLE